VIVTLVQSSLYAVGTPNTASVALSLQSRVYGLNFSPYLDGQDPNRRSAISEAQLRSRMQLIAPYTNWIRTFGMTDGLQRAGTIAHQLGLKAALGAWLTEDLVTNETELLNLITAGKAGQADLLIVGSETLLRGNLTAAQLIDYIKRVKAAVPGIPVTTGDVYGAWLAYPALVQAVDVLFVNYYPYWEEVAIQYAVPTLHRRHQQVVAAAGGKRVVVSEAGWPSCGAPLGDAVPSPGNAARHFRDVQSWAKATGVDVIYFAALDESWKATYEGPQGACWGVFDKAGVMKPGMADVFNGKSVADTWSGTALVGGPGAPAISLTTVPAYGTDKHLKGTTLHSRPADYTVAVYIKVGGGWWIKPTYPTARTPIMPDGTWRCDITTGGSDQNATEIAAYLLPAGYAPPNAAGGSLPAALATHAVASVHVTRSP
jgi:exo-beta-1,3-glucanase (GH17 family)